jgi:hypothetical protein
MAKVFVRTSAASLTQKRAELQMIVVPAERSTHVIDLEGLSYVGQVVSAVAVVASLVYLAHQVRQNTDSQRTENYARALERVADLQARLSSDGQFAAIVARGAADPTRLTAEERVQFTWTFYEMFGAFEFMYHQSLMGSMPKEVWRRWAPTLQWWMSLPGVRAWWLARPTPFSDGFSAFIDSTLPAGPPDPAATQRYATFVRTGAAVEPT